MAKKDLTEKELTALVQIVQAASIQGQDARFIADLIDKLIKSAKNND